MNVLILDGSPTDGRGAASRKLREALLEEVQSHGWRTSIFDLDGMTIKPCRGCFACWVKHPGICAIKDDQEAILREMAASDLWVFLTPVTFGGYSSALKKALDRAIPVLLPFFIKVNGEIHHPQRYQNSRRLVILGTQPEADEEAERIFHGLAHRNALNMASLKTVTRVIDEPFDGALASRKIREILAEAEAG
jgi:multimeric flavodoxin WrbA